MKSVVALGYTCVCGERVRVFHVTRGQANQLPPRFTVACPHGHSATFTSKQVALLELWADESSGAAADEHERAA